MMSKCPGVSCYFFFTHYAMCAGPGCCILCRTAGGSYGPLGGRQALWEAQLLVLSNLMDTFLEPVCRMRWPMLFCIICVLVSGLCGWRRCSKCSCSCCPVAWPFSSQYILLS